MKPLVIDGPRMSDISEWPEAVALNEFLQEQFQKGRRILGIHLWTHSPRKFVNNPLLLSMLQQLKQRDIPLALQVTVTGFGGTLIEPGIEPTEEAYDHLRGLLEKELLSSDRICLRVDPIQTWLLPSGPVSNTDMIEDILKQARSINIRRVRTSLLAFDRYRSRISPRMTSRNLKRGEINVEHTGKILKDALDQGMDISSCANDLSQMGIPSGCCFDFSWITGLPLLEPLQPVARRKDCLCFCPGYARLWKIPRRSACTGRCLACYAQDHR